MHNNNKKAKGLGCRSQRSSKKNVPESLVGGNWGWFRRKCARGDVCCVMAEFKESLSGVMWKVAWPI